MLDKTYPAGTVIKLQKDAANQAEYYIIDEVDAEEIPAGNVQPANSLAITDFGAVAGDGQDDFKALYDCIEAVLTQGKEVWIPAGVFDITNPTSDYDKGDQQNKKQRHLNHQGQCSNPWCRYVVLFCREIMRHFS